MHRLHTRRTGNRPLCSTCTFRRPIAGRSTPAVAQTGQTGSVVSGSRGRLFGRNVLEGVFRAAPDEDLFIGELLVAVDETTDRRYLFRVVDVTYGTEHREPGWAERVAGTLLADDARGEPGLHPLHEQERRTYRIAECRCLGYLAPAVPGSAGVRTVFRKPKSLPTQFSAVVAPTA